jgi:uncharacterized coiled-coil DUF342 family protein
MPVAKQQKIDELDKRLSALEEQRNSLDSEAEARAEKRDRLNDEFRTLRTQIAEMRDKRDKANTQVQQLKQKRNEHKDRAHAKIEELRKLNQEYKTLSTKKPPQSHQTLQKEFDSLEWKIQTSTLSIQEEKQLVEQVKHVETQLNVHKKLEKTKQKLIELRTEIKAVDVERRQCHEKLTQIAQTSQETHEKMLEKIEESKKVKAKADNAHKELMQTIERAKSSQAEISAVLDAIKQVKGEIRTEEKKEKEQTKATLKERIEKQAREKLKRGEKLSWEEFQVLAEKGMEAQD